jgi:hypothetical protein
MVTDEREPVTIDRLKNEVNTILLEDVSRLLIFYSGHGICSQVGDFWLLSNYDRDSDEAVNLMQSVRNGRRLGIGQIGVFSDACRASLSAAALVTGRSIFPVPARRARTASPYDEFLSTDIGDVAQEVLNHDPTKSYGVFSRCLLEALHGREADAAEVRQQRKIVSSISLANWLEKAIPFQSGEIPGASVQYPSITPSWRAPNDEYAELVSNNPSILGDGSVNSRNVDSWTPNGQEIESKEELFRKAEALAHLEQARVEQSKRVSGRVQAFLAQRGRESFETHPGLTIVGAEVSDIVVQDGTKVDLFEENGLWHVRGYGGPHSVALRTNQNLWIAATLFPEFIGTVVVGTTGVESLNYAPPRSSPERDLTLHSERIVAEWSALLSISRQANPLTLPAFADEVRKVKHINPIFGVLAAYAYERSDRIDEVASIGWYFVNRNNFVPFDVVSLLGAYGEPEEMIRAHGWAPENVIVAGGFPMLTRGWSLLDPDSVAGSQLDHLRSGLMDSVWTSFSAAAGRTFADMIKRGEA